MVSLNPALWPIERPNDSPIGDDIQHAIDAGFLYVEDAGHGWNRIGLTDKARKLDCWACEQEKAASIGVPNAEHDCSRGTRTLQVGDLVTLPAGTRLGMGRLQVAVIATIDYVETSNIGTPFYSVSWWDVKQAKQRHTWWAAESEEG